MSEEKNTLDVLRDIIKSIVIAGKGNVVNIGSIPIPAWVFPSLGFVILAILLVWYFRVYSPQQKAICLHLRNGNDFFNIGEPSEAEKAYREAEILDPRNPEIRRSLKKVEAYRQIDNGESSGKTLKNIEHLHDESPNDPQVHLLLGHFHARTDAVKAEQHYLKAISLDSSIAEAYFGLGVLYDKRNQHDKALEMFEKAANTSESDRYMNNLAYLYYQNGKYEQAIEVYEKVLNHDPDYLLAYSETAMVYQDKGDFRTAAEYLKKVLRKFEDNAVVGEPRHKSAWYYAIAGDQFYLSDIADKKFYVLFNLSFVLWLDGKESEAKKYLKLAREISLKDEEAVKALIASQLSEFEKKHPEFEDRIRNFSIFSDK